MSVHTPGRLAVTHNNWEVSTLHCEGGEVAQVRIDSAVDEDTQQYLESVKEDNARRLAACWNYCEDLDTEGMERAVEMNRPAKVFIDKSIKKELELLAQRDALLEALKLARKEAVGWFDDGYGFNPENPPEWLAPIDAAIAKATGEAA